MKSGPKTKPDSNIKAWLKQIARNTAFDILRKNKKYRQFSEIENVIDTKNSKSFNGITEDIDKMIDNLIRTESITTCLELLKWEYRVVLYLKYIEDKSSKEIAKMLGIKEPVMSKRLKKARSALAEVLTQTWGDD
ncbi:ECF RNA polymerase sigma factor SigR [compost metagenome]